MTVVGWYAGAIFFFFQAEDGIRDLVRSRGLGDVYKRQGVREVDDKLVILARQLRCPVLTNDYNLNRIAELPVSYTHLTLPTSDLV